MMYIPSQLQHSLVLLFFFLSSDTLSFLLSQTRHRSPTPFNNKFSSPSCISSTVLSAKKIQFLISDTGGGHRASALSLSSSISKLNPEVICDVVDVYTTYGNVFPFKDYPELYKFMTSFADGILWRWFYEGGETELGILTNRILTEIFCRDSFKECLSRVGYNRSPSVKDGPEDYVIPPCGGSRADMVVSVHPLTQDLPLKLCSELDSSDGHRTPFVTVCTDLGSASRSWFHQGADCIVVPTKVLEDKAKLVCRQGAAGHDGGRVKRIGLPIRPEFMPTKTKAEYKADAGVDEGKPMVLVVGGGDGMGGIVETAKAVVAAAKRDGGTVVVVCGSNKEAKGNLEAEYGASGGVKVLGYTTEMATYMNAADVLVTKGGELGEGDCFDSNVEWRGF